MPHYDNSQRRYLRLFARYVDTSNGDILHKAFERDVRALRESGVQFADSKAMIRGNQSASPFSEFMIKYRFPYAMIDFIYAYIRDDTIDPQLIKSGMFIVSEADKTAVGLGRELRLNFTLYEQLRNQNGKRPRDELKLVIPYGVKLNEVKDFLDNNWGDYIQPRMSRYSTSTAPPNRRIRSRDTRIVRTVLRLKARGLTHAQVASRINRQFNKTYNSNNIGVIRAIGKNVDPFHALCLCY